MVDDISRKREFFKYLTDIIAVFWQFHMDRIAENADPSVHVDFATEVSLVGGRRRGYKFGFGLLRGAENRFSYDVFQTMGSSWIRFCRELGYEIPKRGIIDDMPIPEKWRDYLHTPEVRERLAGLLTDADRLIEEGASSSDEAKKAVTAKTGADVIAGIGTAGKLEMRLGLIYGRYIKPDFSRMLSAVYIGSISYARADLGEEGMTGVFDMPLQTTFDLVHEDPAIGLSNASLSQYRSKETTVGCPAGRMPSAELSEFFRATTKIIFGEEREFSEPALKSFARIFEADFNRRVREPFLELGKIGRFFTVRNGEHRRLLSSRDGIYGTTLRQERARRV